MRELLLFSVKKDRMSLVILTIELSVLYLLFNLSFSCILQSVEAFGGEQNDDAVTMFSYLALAAFTIYFFTVALQNVINYAKNKIFYQICTSLGASLKLLISVRTAISLIIYLCAFSVSFIISLLLDLKYMDEDGIKFFTFSGQAISVAVYSLLFAINTVADIAFILKHNFLKELSGGTDDV